jgi:hypothetical protein
MPKRHTPPEEIDVEIFHWEKGGPNTILRIPALGPCIGIAVYDRVPHLGHMGHFPIPDMPPQEEDFEAMLDSIQSLTRDTAKLKAWLRGGGRLEHGAEVPAEYVEASRSYAESRLGAIGIRDIDTEWNDNPDLTIVMTLDCRDGAFSSVAEDNSEYYR